MLPGVDEPAEQGTGGHQLRGERGGGNSPGALGDARLHTHLDDDVSDAMAIESLDPAS
jgi:hypothetical protein